jgi:type I restriction enzyme S subunit
MILAKELPVAMTEVPMAFNQDMRAILPRGEADPEYLLYALASLRPALLHEIGTSAHGTRRIGSSSLDSLLLPLPPKEEQGAIAAVLRILEAAVETQDRMVATLRELMTATMTKLFREGLRGEPLKQTEIDDIPKSWSVVPLGTLTSSSAFGPRFSGALYSPDGNVATLRTTDIDEDGSIDYKTMPMAMLDLARFEDHLLEQDDLVITRSGTCGIAAVFDSQPIPVLPGAFLIRLRLKTELGPHFIRSWINSPVGRRSTQRLARGAVQRNISGTSLATLLVPLPKQDEQNEIVRRLLLLEGQFQNAQRKRDALQSVFTSTLKLLVTGQIRVPAEMVARLGSGADASVPAPRRGTGEERKEGRPSEAVLQEIVRRIVEAVTPEKIILFGSAARGEMGPDSDLDLLVVKACEHRREVARAVRACLRGVAPGRGKDVVVVTPADVERDADTIGYVIRPALREGRVLYAA